jgi:hypothetical protein
MPCRRTAISLGKSLEKDPAPIAMSELGDELKIGNFKNIITDYVAEHGEIAGMYREPRGTAAPRSSARGFGPPQHRFLAEFSLANRYRFECRRRLP